MSVTVVLQALDVSQYQGTINWAEVAQNYGAVMIRATYGETGIDPNFSRNWQAAIGAGLLVGAYHYADPSMSPTVQAQHFLTTIAQSGGWPMSFLRPALDLEITGGLTATELQDWATAWLTAVEQQKAMPMLYGSLSFLEAYLAPILGHWPLWVAAWGGSVTMPHVGHQYTDAGHILGISGAVDEDRFSASAEVEEPLVAPVVTWTTGATDVTWSFTAPTAIDYRGWRQRPNTAAAQTQPAFRTTGGYWSFDWAPGATSLILTFWFGGRTVSVTHPLLSPAQVTLEQAVTHVASLEQAMTALQADVTALKTLLASGQGS